jgi:hypothetical protein
MKDGKQQNFRQSAYADDLAVGIVADDDQRRAKSSVVIKRLATTGLKHAKPGERVR